MNEKLREKIYDNLYDYLDDNIDEAVDIAVELGFDWAKAYDGASELFDDYFCGDLCDTINAFVAVHLEATEYETYIIDERGDVCERELEDEVEDHIDDIAEKLVTKFENGLSDHWESFLSPAIKEILNEKAVSFGDLFDSCHRHFTGVCVRSNVASETVSFFLQKCRRVAATESVLQYLCKTNFCGVPEEACEKIMEDYEQPNNECSVASVISAEWLEEYGCDSNVTVRKYADMFMEKYKEV